jgi:hypothetical protein
MIRSIAVFMFVLVVGVCSYVLLNPDCYAAPSFAWRLCLVRGCLFGCSCLDNLPFASAPKLSAVAWL